MFVSTVRVLYCDTDQMGVVNHAVALRWFEQARAEWLRRLGTTYRELEAGGQMTPIYEVAVRYRKPAKYDQVLSLDCRAEVLGAVRIAFHYEIRRQEDGELLVEGTTRHAVTSLQGRPRPMSELLRALLDRGIAEQETATA